MNCPECLKKCLNTYILLVCWIWKSYNFYIFSKSKPKTECSNENVATKDLAKSTEQIDLNSDVKKEGKEDEKKGNVSADAKESAEKGMESNDVSKESTKESEESNKDVSEESAEVKAERTENIKEEVDDAEEFEVVFFFMTISWKKYV